MPTVETYRVHLEATKSPKWLRGSVKDWSCSLQVRADHGHKPGDVFEIRKVVPTPEQTF